jgi:threonine synthase
MLAWQALLPPLVADLDLGAGNTPLIAAPELTKARGVTGSVFLKDESQNPTWSHKDRLNYCTVSAGVQVDAPGVVVASSGNHGASAAAYSARAGLPCIVISSADAPPAIYNFIQAYGAALLPVPAEFRWAIMRQVVERLGFHPVSNLTPGGHTGHPFGPEGYKTIAYEVYSQLKRSAPDVVMAPCGYGELLFGIWKGFVELRELGLTRHVPRIIAVEPAGRGPLHRALATGKDVEHVAPGATRAYAIGTTIGSYRALLAVRNSGGDAILVSDGELQTAQTTLARMGIWQELSGVAGVAGLLRSPDVVGDGTVVCILTSSGFKDEGLSYEVPVPLEPAWTAIEAALHNFDIY